MSDVLTRPQGPVSPLSGTVADGLVLAVAPSTGRFRPVVDTGTVEAGGLLGHVTGGRGRADEVRSPVRAVLRDLLVRPGQLVAAGQALVWMAHA